MRSTIFWVSGMPKGRLGILLRPRGGDWLGDEIEAWHQAGVGMVVSLLEPDEAAQLALEDEASAATARGIAFRPLPIPDRGVPASKESVAQLAREIVEALEAGRSVAVHCRQGIGRSGLVAGAVLVAMGKAPASALKAVGAARGLEVPETREQRHWLDEFAVWLATTKAVQSSHAGDRAV